MKWICSSAAAFVAASTLFVLSGCASDPKATTAQEEAHNPCLGYEPPTGSMVRRKSDCGATASGGGVPDDVKEEIRRAATTSRPMPAGAGGH